MVINFHDLIEYNKAGCNRYSKGKCETKKCVLRGQATGHFYPPFDSNLATCKEHETVLALQKLRMMEETWEHVRLIWPQASQVCNYYVRSEPDHKLVHVLNGDLNKLDRIVHSLPELATDPARSLLERVRQACTGGDDSDRTVITVEPLHIRERQLFEDICNFLDGETDGQSPEGS